MSEVKYPKIKVKLTGCDGNAFAILGKVQNAMQRGGCSKEEIAEFMKEAMSGEYDHLLATCMDYVETT